MVGNLARKSITRQTVFQGTSAPAYLYSRFALGPSTRRLWTLAAARGLFHSLSVSGITKLFVMHESDSVILRAAKNPGILHSADSVQNRASPADETIAGDLSARRRKNYRICCGSGLMEGRVKSKDEAHVVIRPARLANSAELLTLIRAYYRFDHIRFDRRTIAPALAKLLRRPTLGRVWIMRAGTRPAGYLVLTYNFDLEFGGLEGLVTDLFVDAPYRGRGLGRCALEFVDNYCRARNI